MVFLSKHISLYALGRLKWILDIIWPLNQHFNLKIQRNWIKQVLMLKFLSGINCILLHWRKKLTLFNSEKFLLNYSLFKVNWVNFNTSFAKKVGLMACLFSFLLLTVRNDVKGQFDEEFQVMVVRNQTGQKKLSSHTQTHCIILLKIVCIIILLKIQ